jgi:hypothetical protein
MKYIRNYINFLLLLEAKKINREEIYAKQNIPYDKDFEDFITDELEHFITRPDVEKMWDRLVIFFYKQAVKIAIENNDDGVFDIQEAFDNYNLYNVHLYKDIIFDFLNSDMRTNEYSFDWNNGTIEQLTELSRQFHIDLEKKMKEFLPISKEKGSVLFETGKYYWIDLQTNSHVPEAEAMGHCATNSQADTLYSLREKVTINGHLYFKSHLTAAINGDKIIELKGRKNSKPTTDLHKHILKLFTKGYVKVLRTHDGYKPELNFRLSDLTAEQQVMLLELDYRNYFHNELKSSEYNLNTMSVKLIAILYDLYQFKRNDILSLPEDKIQAISALLVNRAIYTTKYSSSLKEQYEAASKDSKFEYMDIHHDLDDVEEFEEFGIDVFYLYKYVSDGIAFAWEEEYDFYIKIEYPKVNDIPLEEQKKRYQQWNHEAPTKRYEDGNYLTIYDIEMMYGKVTEVQFMDKSKLL